MSAKRIGFVERRMDRSAARCELIAEPAPDTPVQGPSSFGAATPRRWPDRRLAALICALALGTMSVPAQEIRLVSAPGKFYADDKAGNGIIYNYAAYLVSNNTASTLSSVYVAITNIVSTNRIQLVSMDSGVRALGALSPGQTKLAAFFLEGPGFTGNSDTLTGLTNENHTIQVLNGPPGVGSLLVSSNYSFTNIIYVIEALANKVTIITNLNPYAELGSQVALVIGGDTGTIGGQNSLSFSPAVLGSWRPDCYELNSTLMTFTQNPAYTNRLYFDPSVPGFTNFTGQSYTNTFYFRAVKPTITNLAISPFAFIDSGSGTKHTALLSLTTAGGSNIIYSATNVVTIARQTATPSSFLAPGGTVTYSITFTNCSIGTSNITLDEIVDVLPSAPDNATYIPGSATFNSAPLADPTIVGQTLHWARPFVITANTAAALTFQAAVPWPAGQYTNNAYGLIGTTHIDTTADATDDSPSRSVVTVIAVADIATGKSASTNVFAAANFNYTITVTNFGPSPATTLAVTDSLPVNITFVSATPSNATVLGGQLVWTNLGILASNAVTNLIITVKPPSDSATLTNVASAGDPALDLNSSNNITPPVITSIRPLADLQITKAAPGSVNATSNIVYTISVTNAGPSLAASLSVTDGLPAGVTFVSASAGGVLSGGQVVWANLGNLAAAANTDLTLTVTAPASGASLTNFATVASPTADPNLTNNTSPPVPTTVSAAADIAVSKTAPASVGPGSNFNYTITVQNLGPSPATSLSVTDSLPAGLTFVSASGGGVLSGSQVRWANLGTFGVGVSTNLTLVVTAPNSVVSLTNFAMGGSATSDPNPGNNTSGPVRTSVGASADLAITKSTPASVNAGSQFDYTLTITNLGPTFAASPSVTDDLPAGVTFVSASAGGVLVGSQVIWTNLGDLAAYAATSLILTVLAPPDSASLTNTAVISSPAPDPNPANNSAPPVFTSVTPQADLSVSKIADPLYVPAADGLFRYFIRVTNLGPSVASSVIVTDALPANLSFVNAIGFPFGGLFTGSNVIWNLGDLVSGAAADLSLVVRAPGEGGYVTNIANVGSPTSDPTQTNNTTPPVITFFPPSADLAVSKSAPPNVTAAVNFNYAISVTNFGPSTAGSASITDALPASVSFVSASGGGVLNGSNVVWNLGDLDSGATTNLVLTVAAPTDGTSLTNTAEISSPTPDPNLTNNTSPPVVTGVTPVADVAIGKYGPANVLATGNLAYVIAITNLGPSAATSVTATDAVPAGASFVSASGGGVNNSGIVTWNLGDLANGATSNVTLIVQAPASGSLTNLGSVGSPTGDPNPGNNVTPPVTTAVTLVAGLALTKSGPAATPMGINFDYTIMVTNLGPSTAAALVVTDSLPAGVSFVRASPSAAFDGSQVVWTNLGDLEAGASTTLVLTVSATSRGPVTNLASAGSMTLDSEATNHVSAPIVTAVTNRPPVANPDSATTTRGVAVTIPVLANDSDPDGDPLSIVSATATNGTVSISGTNVVFTPTNAALSVEVLNYTISDGFGGSNSAAITVTVTNLPAVAGNDAYSVRQNSTLTVPARGVLANDTDPDGDTFTAVLAGNPSHGILSLFSNGGFTYAPTNGYVGADSFTYHVNDGSANSSNATVSITITPLADVAVSKTGPTNVLPGASFDYVIGVTNFGPSTASNVVVADSLPTNVVFVSASAGAVVTSNSVIWPAISALPKDGGMSFIVHCVAPTNGAFLNLAAATSTTDDPDLSNNDGSSLASRVSTVVVPIAFGIRQGTNFFNRQTGLYEQSVTVTNIGASTVAAVRLLVGDIRSTNGVPRTNVFLWNASGTNEDLRPYVQYHAPLNPNQTVTFTLEFYNPTRLPFTNSLEAVAVLPAPAMTSFTGGVVIDSWFVDARVAGDPRFAIEWTSIPGSTYTVIYSDDMATWTAATPTVTATATRTQWYDDGPPKTASKPLSIGPRYYRVILNH